ncbi:MAG: diguanylate cyclase domain-containing protein [Candidatus Baltobacteraceae bacterium]
METHATLEALLASLYAQNPDGIAVFDRDGLLVSCNAGALSMTGFRSLQDVLGAHFSRSILRADRDRVQEAFVHALAGGTDHFQSLLSLENGGTMPVEISMFAASSGSEVRGVFAQMRDVLTLHAAEESLTVSQQRFRSLFEYHPDAIVALKPDGTISRVNVSLEATTGYFGEHVIGKPWLTLVAPEHHQDARNSFASAAAGTASEFDAHLLDKSGGNIAVQIKVVPVRVGEEVEGAYVIAKDVRAQHRAEAAIALQSERMRELYLAASARGTSVEVQIDNTLALGCRLFGFDYGYVTRFEGETLAVLNAVGQGAGLVSGTVFDFDKSLSRHLTEERQSLFVADLDAPAWRSDPARSSAPWRSYFASRLIVNNAAFGALVFAGRAAREDVTELDRDLLHLMGLFVAAALERVRYAESIEQLAFFDSLTGLPNRVLFDDRMRQTIGAAKRYGRGFAVMYLDLDDFKDVNDRFGHSQGDRLLKAVVERLTGVLRESDTLARFGGDEFVILQPVVDGAADAADLAQKLVNALRDPVEIEGHVQAVSTSIGVALYPGDGVDAAELLESADRALYRAKRAGRNTWQFSSRER